LDNNKQTSELRKTMSCVGSANKQRNDDFCMNR